MNFVCMGLEPLSEVYPNLWVGSQESLGSDLRSKGFRSLVLCAKEIQPQAAQFPGVPVFRCPFEDDPTKQLNDLEKRMIREASSFVAREIQSNRPVLVTCHAGINRSALVSALALTEIGFTAKDAVDQIRAGRDAVCLNNPIFLDFLGASR